MELFDLLLSRYTCKYALIDPAHRMEHVIEVTERALDYNAKLGLGLDTDMITIVGLLHDRFNLDRDIHHTLCGMYLRYSPLDYMDKYTQHERDLMGEAVEQHRASYKGKYSSTLSEVLASADRGEPILGKNLKRAYQYAYSQSGDHDTAVEQTIAHMRDKFGTKGYCKYPPMYVKYWGEMLTAYKTQCDNVNTTMVENVI